ncbi:MAG: DUF1501 domain-containing protein [Pseudomonadota bacterium]
MKRRELLGLLGFSGLASMTPFAWPRYAQANTLNNRLWIVVQAPGGWDPVSFCNPRGAVDYFSTNSTGKIFNRGIMSNYPVNFIETLGGITYAPGVTATSEQSYGNFVKKYYRDLLVINGIEMSTNNHDIGARLSLSGNGGIALPAFAAYAAATNQNPLILNFLSGGSYINTAGLSTKVSVDGVKSLLRFSDTNTLLNKKEVFPSELFERLQQERLLRAQRLANQSKLPRETQELNDFYNTQLSSTELKLLKSKIPTNLDPGDLKSKIQYICAAMAANLTASAQFGVIGVGTGWDSHDKHDERSASCLKNLFNHLDFLRQEAERQNISDRLNIIVTSDFGRTPYFNKGKGKDHWTVGSMLFMGPDFQGNRTINATNQNLHSIPLNLETMQPDINGEKITIKMIHKTLRALTGTLNSNIDLAFPIDAKAVPKLFAG